MASEVIQATVVDVAGVGEIRSLAVNVRGSVIPAAWLGGYTPADGDTVRVLISDGLATVLGPAFGQERPAIGQVISAGSGTAQISTTIGTVGAKYIGTAPAALTTVLLLWQGTTPYAIGAPAATPPPPSDPNEGSRPGAPAPPKGKSRTGRLAVNSSASGSWRSGFNKWEPGDVKQGAYGSGQPYNGAWFYSRGSFNGLRGKSITKIQLRLGSRLRLGNFNSSVTLRIYRHSSSSPGGNPNEQQGPTGISIPANAGSRWVTLPDSFGEALRDGGGGISLSGGDYGGVRGRSADPASGQLRIYWKDA